MTYSILPPLSMKENMSIKNIVVSQAMLSAFTYRLNNEIMNEDILFIDFEKLTCHPEELAYYGFIITILLLQVNVSDSNNKWQQIEMFSKIEKNTSIILFILMIIFTKNINNAI
jgi:hypothetical protein